MGYLSLLGYCIEFDYIRAGVCIYVRRARM